MSCLHRQWLRIVRRKIPVTLFFVWGVWMSLCLVLLHVFVDEKLVVGERIVRFDMLRIAVVVAIAGIDLLLRYVLFRRIQSISLDIIVFCLVYRAGIILLGNGGSPDLPPSWAAAIPLIISMFFISSALLYWLYKEHYVSKLNEWLLTALPLGGKTDDAEARRVLEQVALQYVKVDLWGLSRADECAIVRKMLEKSGFADVGNLPETFDLSRVAGALLVSCLTPLTIACVYLNAVV